MPSPTRALSALAIAAALSTLVVTSGCNRDVTRRLPIWVPPLPDGSVALPAETCVDRARWIYVVDEAYRLLRFEPNALTFAAISTRPLACHASQGAIPFSMAVDHDATAWVLYSDGSLHRVSTLDGSCVNSGYAPGQLGIGTFGMAFASTEPMGAIERLYVGGSDFNQDAGGQLGIIDTGGLVLSVIGPLPGSPELTGNALAELWGFFPTQGVSTIRKLNTGSGATLLSYDVAMLGPDTLTAGPPRAWAFAFWGGDYWVFYRAATEPTTSVYRFRPPSGPTAASFTKMLTTEGFTIVGAGVSTCVPYILE